MKYYTYRSSNLYQTVSLEELEKELYGQGRRRTKKRQVSDAQEKPTATSTSRPLNPWQTPTVPSSASSSFLSRIGTFGKVMMVGLVIVLLGMLGVAGFYLYEFFNAEDIQVTLSLPKEVMVGDPFVASLAFENTSSRTLLEPRLSLSLPQGVVFIDDPQKRIVEIPRDDIVAGQIVSQDFDLAVVGDPLTVYRFEGIVSYEYEGSSFGSRFQQRAVGQLTSQNPIVGIELSVPEKVFNGQDFEIHSTYQNQTNEPLSDVRVVFELPDFFELNNAEPSLDDEHSFPLVDFAAQDERIAIVSGSVMGEEYAFFPIAVSVRAILGQEEYEIARKSSSVSITPSPLSLSISSNRGDNPVFPDNSMEYRITYANNADMVLEDVVITASLVGEMFDTSNVNSRGFYNPSQRMVTWTAAEVPALRALAVGAEGTVTLTARVREGYPIAQLSDKNFELRIRGEISSSTTPPGISAQQTVGRAEAVNQVAGALEVTPRLYFDDPSGVISNQGSLPPQSGEPIEYTVHWNVRALGTDFDGVELHASLGPGIEWTGKVVSGGVAPSYNERTKEITWSPGNVAAGSGVVTTGPSLIFQIRTTPTSAQIGDRILLTGPLSVRGRDVFVNEQRILQLSALESNNVADQGFLSRDGTVQE